MLLLRKNDQNVFLLNTHLVPVNHKIADTFTELCTSVQDFKFL
jgi:hypothetical protein